jgi:hypothetical protein
MLRRIPLVKPVSASERISSINIVNPIICAVLLFNALLCDPIKLQKETVTFRLVSPLKLRICFAGIIV